MSKVGNLCCKRLHPAYCFLERIAGKHSKSAIRPNSDAACILIEADGQDGRAAFHQSINWGFQHVLKVTAVAGKELGSNSVWQWWLQKPRDRSRE